MKDVRARPRHAVEDDEPQAVSRHVHAVAHGVGSEQARIGLGPEDVDQRRRVDRIDVLGVQRQARRLERSGDLPVDAAKPGNRREQSERAAASRQEQLAVGGRDLVRFFPPRVGDHQHPGLPAIIERRRHAAATRRKGEMLRARPDLRRHPVLVVDVPVPQAGRRDDGAVGAAQHRLGEGDGGIQPVAAHTDVGCPAVGSADLEPVDEGLGWSPADVVQHGCPRARHVGPSVQAVAGGLDTDTQGRFQFAGLGVEAFGQETAERGQRLDERPHGRARIPRRLGQRFRRIGRIGLEAVSEVGRRLARRHVSAHGGEERLQGSARLVPPDSLKPSGVRQRGRGAHSRRQGLPARFVPGDQIDHAALETPGAAPTAFGASDPAPQFRRLPAAQMGGEGVVGRIEQMMSLVEHVAGGTVAVVPRHRRPDHHQGVVGDHEVRVPRLPLRDLDETAAVVRARGIDTLAPAVG